MGLVGAVLDPEEAHGHGFGAADFDSAIGNASSGGVVRLDESRTLRETEFVESGAQMLGIAAIVKEAA